MTINMERKYVMRRLFIGLPVALMGCWGFIKLLAWVIAALGVITGELA